MLYDELVKGIERYGSTPDDVCRVFLGLRRDQVRPAVVLAPWWEPGFLGDFGGTSTQLSRAASIATWNIAVNGAGITYVKTGVGAPLVMDAVLVLGLTPCRRIVFIGSVGALDANMKIGDVVIPESSVCGDGASRYLKAGPLKQADPFGEVARPDADLNAKLNAVAERVCGKHGAGLHRGGIFSIDTIFAQFSRLDEIMGLGCNAIEMETAAAFRAAEAAGRPLVALLSVSDNIVLNKSLISGRTKEEMEYRKKVRGKVFPEIILDLLNEGDR
ncbi:MAG: hypothetical protein JXD23_07405 [Spirochaetales bacterium]|nr:hypothetical protein [Spirochaetales bacterium]